MKKRILSLLVALVMISNISYGQTLLSTLSNLSQDGAKAYLAPVVSGFGANLNTGWIHKAPSSKILGLDVEIGFVFMGTMFGNENKTFQTSGTFRFSKSQAEQLVGNQPEPLKTAMVNEIIQKDFQVEMSGPTIVGSKDKYIEINFKGATVQGQTVGAKKIVTAVKGFLGELPLMPLFAPQISLGTVYGTSASFRFIPSIEINKDLGEFAYFGFGLQHNIGQWIPVPIPVDLSLGFFTQSMTVGPKDTSIFDVSATTFGLYASKTFGAIVTATPYVGLAFESSSIDIKYNYVVDAPGGQKLSLPVSFSLKGENSFRMIIGAAFKLAVLNINVDYNISKYSSFSAGLGFTF